MRKRSPYHGSKQHDKNQQTMNTINIHNDGPELISTNYWETDEGLNNFAYGANAGTMRLFVPINYEAEIPNMIHGCDYVIVSTIRNPGIEKFSIEFLFEDHTNTPYMINVGAAAALGYFPQADPTPVERPLTLWVKGPRKVTTLRAFSRCVPKLPWMKPLRPR